MPLSDKEFLQINQALFSLRNAYQTRIAHEEQLHPTGLKLSDRSVLMVLGQFAPLNSRQLSIKMGINPGTISVYVQRLVQKGLVHKTQNQDDRRNWLLDLTEIGQTLYRDTITGAVSYTRDFLATLTEGEQQTLHQLLLKASHSLGYDWQ